METLLNKTTEILKNNSRIVVNADLNTVFVEAKGNGLHILLESTDIDEAYEIEITQNDKQVTDAKVLEAADLFIYEYAASIINNATPVFDLSDKIHATNLIYS